MTVEQLLPVLVLASMLIGLGVMHQKAIGRIERLESRVTDLELGTDERIRKNDLKFVGAYARIRKTRHNLNNLWLRVNGLDGSETMPKWDLKDARQMAIDELNGDLD